MLFTHFYLCQKKKLKPSCISNKQIKLLNMFFHRYRYKISCFSELAYNSSVPVLIFWTASKSFPLSNSSQKLPFFAVLVYSLYGHPKYFKFKRKYQQIRPVFPDHLSVSYDYGARNLDEYFHFYSMLAKGSKFRRKYLFKKTNNCMP